MHIICEGLSVGRCFIGGKKSAVGGANRGNLAVLDLSNVRKYWAGPPTLIILLVSSMIATHILLKDTEVVVLQQL